LISICRRAIQKGCSRRAECWKNLKSDYASGACKDNKEDVKYKGLKCKAGFIATYETKQGVNGAALKTCSLPRPIQNDYGLKCDLVLYQEDCAFGACLQCYNSIKAKKFVPAAEHKQVGKEGGGSAYLWIDEIEEECYF
jgi:hypothetical protein